MSTTLLHIQGHFLASSVTLSVDSFAEGTVKRFSNSVVLFISNQFPEQVNSSLRLLLAAFPLTLPELFPAILKHAWPRIHSWQVFQ
jgi:hypothetical protein